MLNRWGMRHGERAKEDKERLYGQKEEGQESEWDD
jgi:hypothetical protein